MLCCPDKLYLARISLHVQGPLLRAVEVLESFLLCRAAKSSPAILNEITPSTVRGFLEVARKYGCDGLLDSCTSYLCSDNFKLTSDM